MYTDRPLTWIYKDVSTTQEKNNIIYKFSCHCGNDYVGKTSQRFHVRIDQHVLKVLTSWFDGRSEKPTKKYLLAIGHVCWTILSVLKSINRRIFSFSESEKLFSTAYSGSLKYSIFKAQCKQKKFVYQTRLFKSLY